MGSTERCEILQKLRQLMHELAPGVPFEDKHDLHQGVGKVSKNLKFKAASEVKKPVLAYYVEQALMTEAK